MRRAHFCRSMAHIPDYERHLGLSLLVAAISGSLRCKTYSLGAVGYQLQPFYLERLSLAVTITPTSLSFMMSDRACNCSGAVPLSTSKPRVRDLRECGRVYGFNRRSRERKAWQCIDKALALRAKRAHCRGLAFREYRCLKQTAYVFYRRLQLEPPRFSVAASSCPSQTEPRRRDLSNSVPWLEDFGS